LVVCAVGDDVFLEFSLLLVQKGVLTAQPVVGLKTVVVYYDEKQNEYQCADNIFVTQHFKDFFCLFLLGHNSANLLQNPDISVCFRCVFSPAGCE
jgi:hypothetical protein